MSAALTAYTIPFAKLGRHDVETVGGKNSSLGEMISHLAKLGVAVPDGFATTAQAYRDFLQHEGLAARISKELATLDVDDVEKLASVGAQIRHWILATPFPPQLEREILESFERMSGGRDIAVAVRSSATAEDLPDASFAGQQETFLNVRGRDALLKCVHEVFASLFNDRAIAYRVHQGFAHDQVALSAGIQYMVRSDRRLERRDVHARHGLRLPQRRLHHVVVRSRRNRRAGRGESGRVLRLQAGAALRPRTDPAPHARREGHQDGVRRARQQRAHRDRRRCRRKIAAASRSPTTTSSSWPSRR